MTVINTNIQSLMAQNALKVNNRAMSSVMAELSTGKRINSAKDDAAGLAISDSMTSQIRSLNAAVRNANDGISLAQTAEGAMVEVSNMLQRMRELSVQASTGTLNDTQRGYLNTEFTALSSQISDTVTQTRWNGMAILDVSSSTVTANSASTAVVFDIQVGASSGQTVQIEISDISGAVLSSASISSAANASSALSLVDTQIETLNSARAKLGAVINRFTSAADNATNVSQNLAESRSRILDADYASSTAELARTMILQQAGTAVLAQANQQPQMVLALLR